MESSPKLCGVHIPVSDLQMGQCVQGDTLRKEEFISGRVNIVKAMVSPSNEHPGLVFFGMLVGSPCSPRDSQDSSPILQFKSINSSTLSFLYSPTLTSIHDYIHT